MRGTFAYRTRKLVQTMIFKKVSKSAFLAVATVGIVSAALLTGCKSDSASAPDTATTGTNAAGQTTTHKSSMVDRIQQKHAADSGGK